jgi:polar amino acid transport system substrate-binding protein
MKLPRLAVVAALCLPWMVAPLATSQQTRTLSLVSTAWPPFTNPPGQPRFALDLVEAALGRVRISSTTTIVSAAEFTSSLLSGKFDGSAAAWRDPVRERTLVFSQPYLENRLVLVGRSGADVSAASIAGLKGKRVAIVEGYSYGDAIEQGGPAWVRTASEEDSLAALLKGDADYTLMDELVVNYIVSNHPKEAGTRLQIGSRPLVTRELYFAVARTNLDADSIISRFNAQLRGMIKDRTYHRLLHVEWIHADVDGDGVPEYVPLDDRAGPTAPTKAYSLFTLRPSSTATAGPEKPGFYVGGNIYKDWTSVPEAYKRVNPNHPDARQSTGTLFRFSW